MTDRPGWSRQDRALAELARARGWVEDGPLDRALQGAAEAGGLGSALRRSGLISEAQLASLREAVGEDASANARGGVAPPAADATMVAGTAAGSSPAPEPGPQGVPARIGPYRILRELGRGGMGVVYRALDPQLRREVALKILIAGADASDQAVERFRREASLLARVGSHPHLVQVHDVGREDGRLFFTMDYVEGCSLRDRLDREGPPPPREAARIAAEVASALEAAHRAGVVHRDVKPHNILLGAGGAAYLTDFGLARETAAARGLTVTGEVLGTPAYMSPEQAAGQGRTAGPATDVWSLGATLFEMLTGRVPFEGSSAAEILRKIVADDPPSPSSVRPGIHADLETICLAALRREPARRYPAASAFEADLRRFAAGEPVVARRMSALERVAARAKRHRGVLAAAAVALAVVGFAGARVWRRDREARDAERQRDAATAEGEALLKRGREYLEAVESAESAGDAAGMNAAINPCIHHLREAVARLPEDASAAAWLGRALRIAGLTEEAHAQLTRATQLNPRQVLAWEELGAIAVERLRLSRGEIKHHVYRVTGSAAGTRATSDFRVDLGDGTGDDTTAYKAEALLCYGKISSLDTAPDRAAYGRGMTALMTGKLAAAIAEFDRATELNPFYADAVIARAEAKDLDPGRPRGGVDDWKRLTELRPLHFGPLQGYALALIRIGEPQEVPGILARMEERWSSNEEISALTAVLWYGIGRYEDAERVALAAAEKFGPGEKLERTVKVAVQACIGRHDPDAARRVNARFAGRLHPIARDLNELAALYEEGRWHDCQRIVRAIPREDKRFELDSDYVITIEWRCGNLDLAAAQPIQADAIGVSPMSTWIQALVRMDAGQVEQAVRDFELVRERRPDFITNIVHLAGARFLAGDSTGSAEAMEAAIAGTPMPEQTRKTAEGLVKNFRARLEAAKTPEERGKVLESITGSLNFLAASMPETSPTRRGAKAAANALLYLLQEYYFRAGLFRQSVEAGGHLLKVEPWGCVFYKDARARAAAGKKKTALESLRKAIAEGFDDGSRLDAEKAFDALRADPAFMELRAACR